MELVKIYVDHLYPEGLGGNTETKKLVIYNVNILNQIRNRKLDYPIAIKDESVVIQAGKYICVKAMNKDNQLTMQFFNLNDNTQLFKDLILSLPETERYILFEIQKYIRGNYDLVSVEIELVKEYPQFLREANTFS